MRNHLFYSALILFQAFTLPCFSQENNLLLPEDSNSLKDIREVDFIVKSGVPIPDSFQLTAPSVIHSQGENSDCSYASIAHARSILLTETGKICDKKTSLISFSYTFLRHLLHQGNPCCGDIPPFYCPSRISEGLRIVTKNGIVEAIQWPNNLTCKAKRDSSGASQYRIDGFSQIKKMPDENKNIQNFKTALSRRNPIIVGLYVPKDFLTIRGQKSWSLSSKKQSYSYHAVVITGYSPGYFKVLNSYGPSWGTNGSIWLSTSDFMKMYMGHQSIAFVMDWHCQ